MADYVVTGQRGAGKGIVMVSRLKMGLLRGNKVATNRDLRLSQLLPYWNKSARVVRIPDYPTGEDLQSLGLGSDSADEKTFGHIDMDEGAVWLNSRGWQGKGRQSLLEFLPLTRKYRWHTYVTVQVLESLDKQVRTLLEHHVSCIRTDRLSIPFIGWFLRMFGGWLGIEGKLPRLHVGRVFYGAGQSRQHVEAWTYRGSGVYGAYDTEQKYSADYPHGIYSYLPPWYNWDRFPVDIAGQKVGSFSLWFSPKTGKIFDWPVDQVGDLDIHGQPFTADSRSTGRPSFWDEDPPFIASSVPVPDASRIDGKGSPCGYRPFTEGWVAYDSMHARSACASEASLSC
ncbi:MAG: hypothetical protein H7836_15380 [Magnetococcus sp. YQC-3]